MRIITLADNLRRLITLAMMMLQGLEKSRSRTMLGGSERLLVRQQCREVYRSCNNEVARIGEIVLATMLQGSERLLLQ